MQIAIVCYSLPSSPRFILYLPSSALHLIPLRLFRRHCQAAPNSVRKSVRPRPCINSFIFQGLCFGFEWRSIAGLGTGKNYHESGAAGTPLRDSIRGQTSEIKLPFGRHGASLGRGCHISPDISKLDAQCCQPTQFIRECGVDPGVHVCLFLGFTPCEI